MYGNTGYVREHSPGPLVDGAAAPLPDTPQFVQTIVAHPVPRGSVVIPVVHDDQIRVGQIRRVAEIDSPTMEPVTVASLGSVGASSPTKNDHVLAEPLILVQVAPDSSEPRRMPFLLKESASTANVVYSTPRAWAMAEMVRPDALPNLVRSEPSVT